MVGMDRSQNPPWGVSLHDDGAVDHIIFLTVPDDTITRFLGHFIF